VKVEACWIRIFRYFATLCGPFWTGSFRLTRITQGLWTLELKPTRYGATSTFSTLLASEQDRVIGELLQGRSATLWPKEITPEAFINRLIDLAHEGFYADPGNGGNREKVSWKMIGYDPGLPPPFERA